MACPSCGADQPTGRKFCTKCGTALDLACPSCAAAIEPDAAFCGECGVALSHGARPAAVTPISDPGERRFVTVLFADLVGFTTFSEGRDPEDVRAMLTRYFERAQSIMERFGGQVDKFIGDAVMAVWGADQAREDDAERGVRAALELVDAVAALGAEIGVPDLAARAGVMSGETSVGSGGNEKGLVVGDLVNVASRLQSLAESGSVLVGSTTADLSRAAIDFESAGTHEVKGKSEPVEAWRAVRVVAGRRGSGKTDALTAPFVGRDQELRMLKDLVEAVGRERRVRLISIVGQGGIGKSRLVEELLHHIDGLAEDIYWHQGRSPSYGDGLTFWALGEMVRRRCGIAETDDDHRTATRLRTTLAEYVTDSQDRAWMEPRLAGLLGVGELPAGDKSELYAAWRSFFEYVARRGTTVLVFEDLHWADPGMVDFVDEFASRAPSAPILIVTLARPELLERRPGWGSGRVNAMAIHLAPLSDQDVAELARGMLPGLTEPLVTRIVEKAGGVPLYAIELVRMLVNQGIVRRTADAFEVVQDVTDLEVPDSLHGVVGARIDQLDKTDRDLLQDAAVLGQSFTVDSLAAMRGQLADELRPRLDHFVEGALLTVDRDPRSPERGQYQFVQSLIREVAYGRLTKTDRRSRHLAVASHFESLGEPELAAAVATHYMRAIEAAQDAPDVSDLEAKAYAALIAAADRAAALHSHEQAVALCLRGAEAASQPSQLGRLWIRAALSAHAMLDPRSEEFGKNAIAEFEKTESRTDTLEAMTTLGRIYNDGYRTTDALSLLEPAVERYADTETAETAQALAQIARSYMFQGRGAEVVLPLIDRALALAERLDLVDLIADGLITRGTVLGAQGRPREGLALVHAGTDLAEKHDIGSAMRRGLNNLAYLGTSDSLALTVEFTRRKLDHARRIGEPREVFEGLIDMAWATAGMAEWDETASLLSEIDIESLTRADQLRTLDVRRSMRMWRGEAAEAELQFHDLIEGFTEELGPIQDPQLRANVDTELAVLALVNGRFEEAYDAVMALDDNRPLMGDVEVAIHIALVIGDPALLDGPAGLLETRQYRGRRIDYLRKTIEATRVAAGGETARATLLFSEVDALMAEVGSPIDRAWTMAAAARLLGEEGRELAASAHDLCERYDLGAVTQLFPEIVTRGREAEKAGA